MSSSSEQILRYAADFGRLYVQAAEDRRLLRRVTSVCVGLVQAVSLEDASSRLARAATEVFGLSTAGVYLARKGRFFRLARFPDAVSFPAYANVCSEDLRALSPEPDVYACRPWTDLGLSEQAVVVPLCGGRARVGFLVGEGSLPDSKVGLTAPLFALLTDLAGVALATRSLEERQAHTRRHRRDSRSQQSPTADQDTRTRILGHSPAMLEVLNLVSKLARVDSSVLLRGETGVGKSLVARAIHDAGPRSQRPFVSLNCAAIPEALVESELFGHEAGAFTGAQRLHRGKVEQAEGGTLLLDEVGELPPQVQTKLLTFLEDRCFSRVGGESEVAADVRIVAATNADLDHAVGEKTFRSDLLYRLNVFTVDLPPLRSRGADVLALAEKLSREVSTRYELPDPVFTPQAQQRLLAYTWPGNVRELRNVVERAVILAEGGEIPPELLPGTTELASDEVSQPELSGTGGPAEDQATAVCIDESLPFATAKAKMIERWEIAYLRALLGMTGGNLSRACRVAKIDKKNLKRKLQRYGIDAQKMRDAPGSSSGGS